MASAVDKRNQFKTAAFNIMNVLLSAQMHIETLFKLNFSSIYFCLVKKKQVLRSSFFVIHCEPAHDRSKPHRVNFLPIVCT